MEELKDNSGIGYFILKREDISEALSVVVPSFTRYEPMTAAIQLTEMDLAVFLGALLEATTHHQLSLIARDTESNDIAGVLLAYDFFSMYNDNPVQPPKRFKPIAHFLDTLEKMYCEKVPNVGGTAVHLFILSVAREYNGRKIAQKLVNNSISNAKIKGFKTIFAEATNFASQHILRKSNFKNIYSISYNEYMYKNEYVFSNIKNEESTILMEYCF